METFLHGGNIEVPYVTVGSVCMISEGYGVPATHSNDLMMFNYTR